MENQRMIGFFMVLGGMALIIIINLTIIPNQITIIKTNLVVILIMHLFQLISLPIIQTAYELLILETIKLFNLIETATIFVYAGIALGVLGAVLMYFEGITLEEVDEKELKNENRKNS